ncbi:MAG: transglycosylase domain-containing protein [Thermoleophilaceae bacterium]|nr:transglycosylase domain-containing protein [Thermoleophilaceae bacterium]
MSHRQRQARRTRRRGRSRRTRVLAVAVVLVGVILTAVLGVVGYVIAVASSTEPLSELRQRDAGAVSQIIASDGKLLGYVQSDEIRQPIPQGKMPLVVRRASVAIEDERFYNHEGVDFAGVVRAGVKNIESGKTVEGGSTITQQLVRSLYIQDPERTFERKIKEAKLASELEKKHDKRWILKEYLNTVPYGTVNGRTAIGIQAAARVFFDKDAEDLGLREAALLAGLPQAPSRYNPFREPAIAITRRNDVLEAMAKQGMISEALARRAAARPLGLKAGIDRFTKRKEPYFFDYVQEELIERYGVGVYRRGGLKVHTTIDPKLQEAGRNAINGQLGQKGDPSSAVVSIDPKTGYIKAMASSGTYNDRTFNLAAQGRRQPGSAFKTFVLVTALRRGVNPNSTTYTSKPLQLNVPGYGPWKVETYDKSYGGSMNLVEATVKSDNSVYAQLDVDLGPKEVAKTAKLMGITTKLDGIPSEGLGGLRLGVSPLEIANAYATLASGGMRNEPLAIRRVEFADGKKDEIGRPKRKRVFSDGVAAEATKILEKNVQAGTGTAANIGCPAAGKTGTTDNFNDAWFVGYTPALASSTWVGYPNALKEMRAVHGISVAGGTFPARIWGAYMKTAKRGCKGFPKPNTAFQSKPFFGRFSKSGGSKDSGLNPYKNSSGQGYTEGGGRSGGGGGYNPNLYEAPLQQAPNVKTPKRDTSEGGGGTGGGGTGGGGEPGGGNDGAGGNGQGGEE